MRYRGTLEVDANRRDGGLAVELALTGRTLTVSSDEDVLGSYPIDEVELTRVSSDRFDLRIGPEQLVFTAEDAIRFSYEALPLVESFRPHRTQRAMGKFRSWLTDNQAVGGGRHQAGPKPVTSAGLAFTSNSGLLSELRRQAADDVDNGVGDDGVADDEIPAPSQETSVEVSDAVRSVVSAGTRVAAAGGLNDLVARLEKAVADVHEGRLDAERAQAMASLALAMVETAELAKSEEARNRAD